MEQRSRNSTALLFFASNYVSPSKIGRLVSMLYARGRFYISFSFSAAKAPLPKGGWQKSLIFAWGIAFTGTFTIPPSRLAPCHPQAPFVCFADIFPANGEIYPLHKGGFAPTIILQITLFVFVKKEDLYRRIYFR